MRKIAVLIDFTSVCEIAIEHAAVVARGSLSPLILVNIADPKDKVNEKELKEKMKSHAHLLDREEIPYLLKVGYGEFFSTIPGFLDEIGADFVIVGTHGIKGIADVSYGLNILRLVDGLGKPILIVQGHSEAPVEGYDTVLIPNVDNDHEVNNVNVIKRFTDFFKSKMTMLDYRRSEKDIDERETYYAEQFKSNGMSLTYDYEVISEYVRTFSRSILEYASIEDVNLIIWAQNAKGYVFDIEDKENLILNRQGVAVLFIPSSYKMG